MDYLREVLASLGRCISTVWYWLDTYATLFAAIITAITVFFIGKQTQLTRKSIEQTDKRNEFDIQVKLFTTYSERLGEITSLLAEKYAIGAECALSQHHYNNYFTYSQSEAKLVSIDDNIDDNIDDKLPLPKNLPLINSFLPEKINTDERNDLILRAINTVDDWIFLAKKAKKTSILEETYRKVNAFLQDWLLDPGNSFSYMIFHNLQMEKINERFPCFAEYLQANITPQILNQKIYFYNLDSPPAHELDNKTTYFKKQTDLAITYFDNIVDLSLNSKIIIIQLMKLQIIFSNIHYTLTNKVPPEIKKEALDEMILNYERFLFRKYHISRLAGPDDNPIYVAPPEKEANQLQKDIAAFFPSMGDKLNLLLTSLKGKV